MTFTTLKNYLYTLYILLKADWIVFRQNLRTKIIDNSIVVVIILVIWQFIMPTIGISKTYGSFMLGSLLASAALFESYSKTANMISDFAGERKISYYLTLPIPSWLVFIKIIWSFALQAAIMSLVTLVVGSIALLYHFNLLDVSFWQFIPFIFICSLFFGSFALWIISLVPNMHTFSTVWTRYIFPLWMLGGFQFSWLSLYRFNKWGAYINLINPLLYTSEGYRSTILDAGSSLPFVACISMLFLFYFLFSYASIVRIKKRLDFV